MVGTVGTRGRVLPVPCGSGYCSRALLCAFYQQTRWKEIADLYAMLERIASSPLHTLNRAVAVAEWQGPEAGLAVLEGLAPPAWVSGSYLWDAVLGDLHWRARDTWKLRANIGSGRWARLLRMRCVSFSGGDGRRWTSHAGSERISLALHQSGTPLPSMAFRNGPSGRNANPSARIAAWAIRSTRKVRTSLRS